MIDFNKSYIFGILEVHAMQCCYAFDFLWSRGPYPSFCWVLVCWVTMTQLARATPESEWWRMTVNFWIHLLPCCSSNRTYPQAPAFCSLWMEYSLLNVQRLARQILTTIHTTWQDPFSPACINVDYSIYIGLYFFWASSSSAGQR